MVEMIIKTNFEKGLAARVISGETEGRFHVSVKGEVFPCRVVSIEAPGNHPVVAAWERDGLTKVFAFPETGYSPKDLGMHLYITCDAADVMMEGEYGVMKFNTHEGDDCRIVYFLQGPDPFTAYVGLDGKKSDPVSTRRKFNGEIPMAPGEFVGVYHMDEAKKHMFDGILGKLR